LSYCDRHDSDKNDIEKDEDDDDEEEEEEKEEEWRRVGEFALLSPNSYSLSILFSVPILQGSEHQRGISKQRKANRLIAQEEHLNSILIL